MIGSHPAVAVAVPVRNEAERLPALLHAMAGQRSAPPFTLCLFLDGCTDASRAVIEGMAPALPYPVAVAATSAVQPANAGRARARACALAMDQGPALAIVTTDADSRPEPDWLAAKVAALRHAEVVAGRILVPDEAGPLTARLTRYYDRLHAWRRRLDPVDWEDEDTHHWTSAASLAMTPALYRTLGGFAALGRGEDADFADRAWRAGARLRRDGRAMVWTSARRVGRAPGGFASVLAALGDHAASPRVSHPADEGWRYRHHAHARQAFEAGRVDVLAAPLRLHPADLARVAAEVANADAFAARVVGDPAGGMRQVSLDKAEAALEALRCGMLEGVA